MTAAISGCWLANADSSANTIALTQKNQGILRAGATLRSR